MQKGIDMMHRMKEDFLSLECKSGPINMAVLEQRTNDQWMVCLHGLQSSKEMFENLLRRAFFRDLSYLAIDFVGFGHSAKPESFSYTLEDQADMVEQLVKQMGIRNMHLIGHSLGGMVGILLLERLKAHIASFINMEGNLTLEDCGMSLKAVQYDFDAFKKSGYGKIKSEIAACAELSAPSRLQWLELIPDYVFYTTSRSIVDWSKSGKMLKKFLSSDVRKLFLYGDQNRRKTKCLDSSVETAEIPHAGHFMLMDNPDACAGKITAFIATAQKSDSA